MPTAVSHREGETSAWEARLPQDGAGGAQPAWLQRAAPSSQVIPESGQHQAKRAIENFILNPVCSQGHYLPHRPRQWVQPVGVWNETVQLASRLLKTRMSVLYHKLTHFHSLTAESLPLL